MSRRPPTGAVKVRREAKESTTPPVRDWEGFCCAKPGHFWVYEEDIDKVRGEFLAQGRHPKVVLKDASRIKSLRYTFCKRADDQEHKGVCGPRSPAGLARDSHLDGKFRLRPRV